MNKMRIQDKTGDTEMTWNPSDAASVAEVKNVFNKLLNKGHMGYKTDNSGGGEVIRTFDPTAEEIVVTIPLVGG
ncbi:MAG: hypothetical protein ACYC1K_03435 [Minisyncoccota bacterium]